MTFFLSSLSSGFYFKIDRHKTTICYYYGLVDFVKIEATRKD